MHQSYEDILAIAREARRPIGWWDENGVPRFAVHHPSLCPDIYATEVALILISCQSCGQEFPVQMSWDLSGEILTRVKAGERGDIQASGGLAATIESGVIHYGDPPHHDDCGAGMTMNCWDLRVIEFWSRNRTDPRYHDVLRQGIVATRGDWLRIPELEIELPDAKDPYR